MEHQNENGGFSYTYSGKEREDVLRIREKYTPTEPQKPDPMQELIRLDAGVTRKATVCSLIAGILGSLLLGLGMSLFMTDLSAAFPNMGLALAATLVLGTAGMVLIALAYPIYKKVTETERKRIAPEILRLTDELLK